MSVTRVFTPTTIVFFVRNSRHAIHSFERLSSV